MEKTDSNACFSADIHLATNAWQLFLRSSALSAESHSRTRTSLSFSTTKDFSLFPLVHAVFGNKIDTKNGFMNSYAIIVTSPEFMNQWAALPEHIKVATVSFRKYQNPTGAKHPALLHPASSHFIFTHLTSDQSSESFPIFRCCCVPKRIPSFFVDFCEAWPFLKKSF